MKMGGMKYDFTLSWSKFLEVLSDAIDHVENEHKDSIAYADFTTKTVISGAPFRDEIYLIVQQYANDPKFFHIGYAIVYPYANSEWVSDVHLFRLSDIKPYVYSSFEGLVAREIVKKLINELNKMC